MPTLDKLSAKNNTKQQQALLEKAVVKMRQGASLNKTEINAINTHLIRKRSATAPKDEVMLNTRQTVKALEQVLGLIQPPEEAQEDPVLQLLDAVMSMAAVVVDTNTRVKRIEAKVGALPKA